MKIAFLDASGWDFTIDTPYERPLGGSQSALCYLAEALAALGHEVRLLNGRADAVMSRGVLVGPLNRRSSIDGLKAMDAVIALNGISTEFAALIRAAVGPDTFMAFWTQHAHDQPAVGNLKDAAMRAVWDAYVLISDWQAGMFRQVFGLPAERIRILRNALGPAFAGIPPAPRPWPPVLAYTSTPFRGLDLLLDAFPRIRAAVPGTVLRVYSSMGVYQVAREHDQHAPLYERCRTTEGVEYIGSLPQPRLAVALREATALAYPNTFAETSCISVMEALAAGCAVISTDLGALPETAAGWGHLMPFSGGDRARLVEDFTRLAVEVLEGIHRAPVLADARRTQQVARLNATTTWPVRAVEWVEWLTLAGAGRGAAQSIDVAVRPPALAERIDGTLPVTPATTITRGRHGLFLADDRHPEGLALRFYGDWLEELLRPLCYAIRPGDVMVEIGAGLGGLTVPLARRIGPAGRVRAFVDDPATRRLLEGTLALNGLNDVEVRDGRPPSIDAAMEGIDGCRLLVLGDDGPARLVDASAAIDRLRPFVFAPTPGVAAFDTVRRWAATTRYRLYWCGGRAVSADNPLKRTDDVLGGAGRLGVLAVPAEAPTQIVGAEANDMEDARRMFGLAALL